MTTVLIVDDHPSFRACARLVLQADGFDVVGEAENGAQAIAQAEALEPDVVLLDVQLPDDDGFAVARRLRSDGNKARVVLVSSRDDADYASLAYECGARGFIGKGDLTGAALAALLM